MRKAAFSAIFAVISFMDGVLGEFAVLRATEEGQEYNFCVAYSPKWKDLPTTLATTSSYPFVVVPGNFLCHRDEPLRPYNNKALFSLHTDQNCSFSRKHDIAQYYNASELIIVNKNDSLFIAIAYQETDYINSTIPLAVMKHSDYNKMIAMGDKTLVQLYVPPLATVDCNLLVIWLLAVGTVVVGAWWSGSVASEQRTKLADIKASSSDEKLNKTDEEEPAMSVTPLMVVVFVILICGFLLLVYYLYKYVIYVIITVFAFSSASGAFECLNAAVKSLSCAQCRIPPNKIPMLKGEPFVKTILVWLVSVGLAIWWVVVRNDSYGWVLQDILGILFCVFILRTLRLPSMKICSLLLILLLIYDVFFVFITPLFSAGHHSVMVDVATGEGSNEQIPMVIKVPRIVRSAILVCQRDYSLLGFGDILVPGLFVSFCHSYDRMAKTPFRIYFVASSIAYGIGLIITFAALYLTKEGQPALVYLVPCTLGTVYIISLIRGEFCSMWKGVCLNNEAVSTPNSASDGEDDIFVKTDSNIVNEEQQKSGERDRLLVN